jgi:exosortase/archaeosortase family protein
MKKRVLTDEGFVFIAKFLGLFVLLYYGNLLFISITYRGGNALFLFLRNHVNYIDWLRYSVLYTSKFFGGLLGIKSHIENVVILKLDEPNNHKAIKMVYECIGYGIMSFWAAFVIANKNKWTIKLLWVLLGWVFIWIINCTRITILLYAIKNNWPINQYFDHHTLFNIVAYGFVLLLIYVYIKKTETR